MEWVAVIGSIVAVVVSFGTLAKLLSEGRRAHRQDEERRQEKERQAEAERQLAELVRKLQEPSVGGCVFPMASPELAGAELGIRLGVLFGFWDKGNRCFRLATKDDVKDLVEKRALAADGAKREWWAQMKRYVEESATPCGIPEDTDPAWVLQGEAQGYFKRIRHPAGHWELWRP